ncbi:cache domain-containing protein [Oceanirhabdus sp. W0125-5]|uniref:cache domain-containing protein n=1 Tax=Oceanirhabdus sp. W0125-5 TaxID=2999116 RepID=UPI0022F2AA06|nr:cache domain-containing protein [Oceanirhabdus sp. W0125-5]WBW94919.1 cache domain-containing protein [Oceanirhabdus sp. W0125-5]
MKLSTKVKRISSFLSIIFSLLIIIILASFVFQMSYIKFNKDAEVLREAYYAEHRELIRDEVYRVYDFIEYHKSMTEERLKKEIKERVYEAISIVSNIYDNNKNKTQEEIDKLIKDALCDIRFNNGTGYYFANRLDGTGILNSPGPNLDGHNLINFQNSDGVYVLKDIIELVEKQGEGFYEYTWTKPDITGNNYRKISYVKYFKPLDMYIGTGLYIDDVEEIVKKEVLERISKIRYRNGGYFFVTTYDGTALVFAQDDLVGKDISNIKDINNVEIHKEEKKVIDAFGQGYVEYVWPKPDEEGVYPKITFVKGIQDWKWILGTGAYTDDIEKTLEIKKEKLKKEIRLAVFKISLIIFLIGLIISFIQVYLLKWAERGIKEEEKIYEILTNLSEDGIFILEASGKIIECNHKGLQMISYNKNEINRLNFKDIIMSPLFNEGIIENNLETYIKDKNNKTMPVDLHIKSIKIKRKKKFIAYARDLTKRRLYEETLKHKAMTDELTNVYNRRFILTQLNSEIEIVKEIGNSTSVVLLDVDKFKTLNDTYGHIFGDKVLKELCTIFTDNLRNTDFIGRYGGEEFIIILPNTNKTIAFKIIERIKNSFEQFKWDEDEKLKITFSAGIVEVDANTIDKNVTDYIEEADKLLYKAKENGRNRIEIN